MQNGRLWHQMMSTISMINRFWTRRLPKRWLKVCWVLLMWFWSQNLLDFSEKPRDDGSNVGESYFVSKAMYEAMDVSNFWSFYEILELKCWTFKLCRCGRKKQGVHLTKCMQKCVIKYSESEKEIAEDNQKQEMPNIPRTSNNIHGFFPCKYLMLERSTYHVSPKTNLKHKITDSIYNSIIIGWLTWSFKFQKAFQSFPKLYEFQ